MELQATKKEKAERMNITLKPGTLKKIEELRYFYYGLGGFNCSAFLNGEIDDFYNYTVENQDKIKKDFEKMLNEEKLKLNESEVVHPAKKELQPTQTNVKTAT